MGWNVTGGCRAGRASSAVRTRGPGGRVEAVYMEHAGFLDLDP